MTLNDPEGHFCCLQSLYSYTLGSAACINYDMFTHVSETESERGL